MGLEESPAPGHVGVFHVVGIRLETCLQGGGCLSGQFWGLGIDHDEQSVFEVGKEPGKRFVVAAGGQVLGHHLDVVRIDPEFGGGVEGGNQGDSRAECDHPPRVAASPVHPAPDPAGKSCVEISLHGADWGEPLSGGVSSSR